MFRSCRSGSRSERSSSGVVEVGARVLPHARPVEIVDAGEVVAEAPAVGSARVVAVAQPRRQPAADLEGAAQLHLVAMVVRQVPVEVHVAGADVAPGVVDAVEHVALQAAEGVRGLELEPPLALAGRERRRPVPPAGARRGAEVQDGLAAAVAVAAGESQRFAVGPDAVGLPQLVGAAEVPMKQIERPGPGPAPAPARRPRCTRACAGCRSFSAAALPRVVDAGGPTGQPERVQAGPAAVFAVAVEGLGGRRSSRSAAGPSPPTVCRASTATSRSTYWL